MKSANQWAIGVDIGGTKIAFAGVDAAGKILHQFTVKTDVQGGAKAVEAQIIAAARELQSKLKSTPSGVGIGMAGQIDADSGVVFFAPNLYWHDVPLKSNVQDALKIPVVVLNDVRAGTYGEWKHGAGRNCKDLVCIFVGTGVGGGIVNGGKMLKGYSNTAGELGHTVIDLHGRKCTCGNSGCLESIAGGWAITQRAKEAIEKNPKEGTPLLKYAEGNLATLNTKMVVEAAHAGDPLSKRLIDETVEALIAGSVTIVNGLNPQRLIFGGGVIKGLPEIVKRIEQGVKQRALKAATQKLEVIPTQLGTDCGFIGAASYAMTNE